jgi:hypothetical protein
MNGNVIRVPARSLKEQFSRGSGAWKEQSDPIFRFWAEGDWWGFPFFSLSASRYFGGKEIYAGFCVHRATSLKSDGKDILSVTMVPNSEHSRADSGNLL